MAAMRASLALGVLAPLSLTACGPSRDTQAMPRIETAIVAAQRAAPEPVAATTAAPAAASAPTGAPDPEASAPGDPRALAPVRALDAKRETWEARLRRIPKLSRYASRFVPFDAKAANAALTRGERSRGSVTAWSITGGPFAWSPDARAELFVAAGSIGERAMVAVLEVQPGGALRHAASLVIDDRDTSVAIGVNPETPRELLWTTCYGCPGEGGSIVLGDDGRPRFVYR
jgi:hypothetical protein